MNEDQKRQTSQEKRKNAKWREKERERKNYYVPATDFYSLWLLSFFFSFLFSSRLHTLDYMQYKYFGLLFCLSEKTYH